MNARTEEVLKIAEEAAQWLHRLKEDDAAHHAQFAAWLKQSPRHMHEFLMITAVSQELDAVDPDKSIDVRQWIGEDAANLVPLRDDPRPAPARFRARQWVLGVAVAAAVVVAVALGFTLPGKETYRTAIGEQRTVKLDDGSVVYLNTRSRAKVHYTSTGRDIRLEQGEALFVVARDAKRPFRVATGDLMVQAVGTQFNVLTRETGTAVSVVEGKVRVSALRAENAAELAAGEQVDTARHRGLAKQTAPNVPSAIAWRQRRLVFRDDPLSDIVAEFNRYNRAPQFRIAAPEVGERRYTGTFDADDPESLAQLLNKESDLTLERTATDVIVRPR